MPIPAGSGLAFPTWAPSLAQVAAHVPRRTLVGAVDGYGVAVQTFTGDTYPTASAVESLVADACRWVQLVTGAVNTALELDAAAVAALRAAGLVELTYPDNREDLTDGETLLKLAADMRKDLAAANIALIGNDPATDVDDVLPEFSFPAASTAGDWLL